MELNNFLAFELMITIVIVVLIIIFFGLGTAEFSHDFLFRVFLFAAIAGYYFAWFSWATKEK